MSTDKRKWDDAIKNGLRAYTQREKYAYMYGAKGQVLTLELIDYFINAAPDHFKKYSAEELNQIRRNSVGKIGYDCSGYVGWVCTGDKHYSTAQFENSSFRTQDMVAGVAGSILYTTYGGIGRHIGIDMGYGYCLDMAYESTDANIREGKAGIRLYKILDNVTPWEWSARSNVLDYTGANNR